MIYRVTVHPKPSIMGTRRPRTFTVSHPEQALAEYQKFLPFVRRDDVHLEVEVVRS